MSSPTKFNIHGTNKNIKVKVMPEEIMRSAGFDRKNSCDSWLLVKSFTHNADFWFELWGDGEDDFCIEVLDVYKARPYINNVTKEMLLNEINRLMEFGIIEKFNPKEIVFRYRYKYV